MPGLHEAESSFGGNMHRVRFAHAFGWGPGRAFSGSPESSLRLYLDHGWDQRHSRGRAGLALCVFHAFQEFMVGLKLAELRRARIKQQ